VDYLHFPRLFRARHFQWDLDRGFRLEILNAATFWLALLDADGVVQAIETAPQGQEQDFLLHVDVNGSGRWPDWERSRLSPHTVCAILSDSGRPCRVPRDWPNLVIWVRQNMLAGTVWTGNDFFTPEQTLYQWGRVGRRVQRRSRWRPLLPW
jgi:hypothetical protein